MAFAQIYTSSSRENISVSPSDALLEGTDVLTEQAHAACPKKASTGSQFPSTFHHYFYLDKNLQLEHSHACRVATSVSTGI